MTERALRWGVRYKGSDQEIDEMASRAEAVRHMARVNDGGEIVMQMLSPWMPENVIDEETLKALPATECQNCKSTNLGFEPYVYESQTGVGSVKIYQGCNECSETVWTGDWDTFHAVLALLFDIRIPRCD